MRAWLAVMVLGGAVCLVGAVGITRFDKPASVGQVAAGVGGTWLIVGWCAKEILDEIARRS